MLTICYLLLLVAGIAWVAERLERRRCAREELSRMIRQHTQGR